MARHQPYRDLCLARTAEGWALVSGDGRTAFEASGAGARVTCLREARRRGVMRLQDGATPRFAGRR